MSLKEVILGHFQADRVPEDVELIPLILEVLDGQSVDSAKIPALLSAKYIPVTVAVERQPHFGLLKDYVDIPTYASGRPRTPMSYLTPHVGSRRSDQQYLPVVRYGSALTRGFFKNHGTLYYLEPESDIFLATPRCQTYATNQHLTADELRDLCRQAYEQGLYCLLFSDTQELIDVRSRKDSLDNLWRFTDC
jgi:hypothetical protein